jgi:hypothetical protein
VGNESYRFPRRLVIANDNARLSRDVFSPPLQIFETHHTSEQNQGSLSPYDGQCANVASWGAKQYQYGDRWYKEHCPKKPKGVESLGSEVLHVAALQNLPHSISLHPSVVKPQPFFDIDRLATTLVSQCTLS